jgi:hypothetical protein
MCSMITNSTTRTIVNQVSCSQSSRNMRFLVLSQQIIVLRNSYEKYKKCELIYVARGVCHFEGWFMYNKTEYILQGGI